MKVHLPRYHLTGDVRFGRYATGEIAIQLVDDGEMVAVPTVNIQDWGAGPAPEGHIWVKTWSENAGMVDALLDAGIIERNLVASRSGGYGGQCLAVLARLTPAALAELKTQEQK